MEKIKTDIFKHDNIERKAFNILARHLFYNGSIHIKDVYHILSGVRKNNFGYEKLTKEDIKKFLRKWRKENLIRVFRGRVSLNLYYFTFHLLSEETLKELADFSTKFWIENAPHQLGDKSV
jgi:hypothetical protein